MAETKDKLATLSQVKRYVESAAGGGRFDRASLGRQRKAGKWA